MLYTTWFSDIYARKKNQFENFPFVTLLQYVKHFDLTFSCVKESLKIEDVKNFIVFA